MAEQINRTPGRERTPAGTMQEVSQQSEHMQLLLAIIDTALSHVKLDDLFHEVLHRIRIIMHADNIAVLSLSEDTQFLTIRAVDGLETEVASQVRIPLGVGFAGHIAAERKPIILQKPIIDEVMTPILRKQAQSLLGVPLIVQGRVIGVLHIGMKEVYQFTSSDIHLLECVAHHLALAIERASLHEIEHKTYQEAALHASQFKAMLASVADSVFICDKDGRIIYMNEAAHTLLPEDFATLPLANWETRLALCDEYGHPFANGHMPLQRILHGDVLKGNTAVDTTFRSRQQRIIQMNLSGAPLRDEMGHIIGAVCIGHDVTERSEKERRIRDGLQSLLAIAELLVQTSPIKGYLASKIAYGVVDVIRSILGCQGVGLVTIEEDSSIIHPIAESGFSSEQTSAWFSSMIQSPSRLLDMLKDSSIQARLQNNETILVNSTGGGVAPSPLPRIVLINSTQVDQVLINVLYIDQQELPHPIPIEELTLIEALTKVSALTIEREHRVYEREMLLFSLQQANAQLENIFAHQKSFISVVSHEVRTTLTAIQGFSEILSNEGLSTEEVKEYATDIHSDAMRLNSMITRFLDLEYMKSGNVSFQWEKVNVNGIVREVTARMESQAPVHTLHLELDETVPDIMGDKERLMQVISNLVANAVKYSPVGSEILLKSCVEQGSIHFSLHDQGIGIPPHGLQAIFDPFSQIHAQETHYIEGAGLGLPLARQIVQMHGGHIWVESILGEGSCFHVTLPLIEGSLAVEDSFEFPGEDELGHADVI